MATAANLSAQPRDSRGKGNARKLRSAGRVPAVIYGHGEATRSVTVDTHELERLFSQIHRDNTVITLRIEGEKAEVKALVREVQSHAYRGTILHVDFYQVHAGERITVSVPIHLVGTPAGVRLGGILQQTLNDLEIECLSDQIPDEIRVDVSQLDVGDSIHVSELPLGEGMEAQVESDRTVCSVVAPTVSAVEAPAEAVEPPTSEPEVIRRRREEESGT